MISVFEKYRYKYEPANLFTRFMEYVITGFDQTFSPVEKPFNQEEGQACHELMSAWILVMNDELKRRESMIHHRRRRSPARAQARTDN